MSERDFLVEIGTEELPPKALSKLSAAFESGIRTGLEKAGLKFESIERFATPRRLAVLVSALAEQQADKVIDRLGPATKAAFDGDGNATRAALGFAKSCGVEVSELKTSTKDGVEKLSFSATQAGMPTADLLQEIVASSLAKLPIPKRMRWGSSRIEFVRPVHWVVMLFGEQTVEASILGIKAGATTRGHRFHHNLPIQLALPADYESVLENTGSVIPSFEKRKESIRKQVVAEGEKLSATVVLDESLLDEVTGLVEFPVALAGKFEEEFLEVPAEALILAMKSHQKCFNLVDSDGKLIPHFITVSNIRSQDPVQVIEGNERVIRPRLADARFFYETDKKHTLESRQEQLKKIVFQDKLGTVFDKSTRVAKLAKSIARKIDGNPEHCERAAMLAKCDLVTKMVGEFADLQGLMGYYYAVHDGEAEEVASALNEQYMPRYAGDDLPASLTGCILAVSEKLDSMVGMFAIGQPPTGSKDPFALRRSAIGVLRILVEKQLDIDLLEIISEAATSFEDVKADGDVATQVFDFMLERFRSWYLDEGISADVFQSVMALKPQSPLDFHKRVLATHHFSSLPQASALAAANKRVSNLLAKQALDELTAGLDTSLFQEEAETRLFNELSAKELEVTPLFASGDYQLGLESLAGLRDSVDAYFDDVLVMCEDLAIRNNRIVLLHRLRSLFFRVADISYLHKS